jgi:hypothetical protein
MYHNNIIINKQSLDKRIINASFVCIIDYGYNITIRRRLAEKSIRSSKIDKILYFIYLYRKKNLNFRNRGLWLNGNLLRLSHQRNHQVKRFMYNAFA